METLPRLADERAQGEDGRRAPRRRASHGGRKNVKSGSAAVVAQLVERLIRNHEVPSSILGNGTIARSRPRFPRRLHPTPQFAIVAATILIVDDDPSLLDLIRLHLTNAGYQVRTAGNGIEAGYAVLREPPDLLITDVQMPDMDGFALVEALRKDASLPRVPVIFLTALAQGEPRGWQLAADGYLTKPVRANRLLDLVSQVLGRKA